MDALISRCIERTPTDAGLVVAELWDNNLEVLHQLDIAVSSELYDQLQDLARSVQQGETPARDLLTGLQEALGDEAVFVDLLEKACEWSSMEATRSLGRGGKGVSSLLGEVGTLEGFELIRILGKGSFGHVYEAKQTSLDRPVAIKVLSPDLQKDEDFVGRLRHEAKVAARMRHPNVVAVIDQGTCAVSGVEFIVFEFVDGETARSLLKKGRLSEADAVTICLGVAEALACAEGLGIIHRDVKPDNILIGKDGIPKLADLGLARRLDEVGEGTRSGFIVGTPHYISPEQAMGEPLDIRTDIYSLGISLFRLLTDKVPLPSKSPMGVVARHVNEEVPDVREVDPELSKHVAQLISWMTAKDRSERYPTAKAAAESLRRVLEGKPPIRPRGEGRVIKPPSGSLLRPGPEALGRLEPSDEGPVPEPVVKESTAQRTADRMFGKGRGFYDDEFLLEELQAIEDSRFVDPPGDDPDMLLSEDGARAYQVMDCLSDTRAGQVFEAAVMGNQTFDGIEEPVLAVVIKISRKAEMHAGQHAILKQPDRRLPLLLDTGLVQGLQPYLVLERLLDHPMQRFGGEAGRVRVDPCTAVETFVNLLESLKSIHFRRPFPLVLCAVKPSGIKLRMKTRDGTLTDMQYLQRLATGAYEPVFTDLSCALHRDALREAEGRVKEPLGSPLYLPPESFPRAGDRGGYKPGTYSAATDAYSLCLSFYVHLTGDRLYASEGIYRTTGRKFVETLEGLKLGGHSPVDRSLLEQAVGAAADEVAEILAAGLHADPQKRANPHKLLQMCRKRFQIDEVRGKDTPGFGRRLRQNRFPRPVPGRTHYLQKPKPATDIK